MTNSYDVDHGLSQDAPGPLGLEGPDDTPARTGNTARDQEMYAAGRAVGEENAKHNAAIRGGVPDGWKLVPVEPTRKMWEAVNKLDDEMAAGAYDGKGASIEQIWACLVDAAPSCLTCGDNGMVGGLTQHSGYDAQPCPDCAAPASPVSTVEQDPPAAYLTLDEEGSPCMLFFDVVEARTYCEVGEEPVPLYRRPAPAAGDARDAHFDLWQDDMVVASASGPRAQALQEIQHYAAVYSQDGPVQIEEVIRIPLNAAQRQGDA